MFLPDGCPTSSGNIEDEDDPVQVRNCRMRHVGANDYVHDLKTDLTQVRANMASKMNELIRLGVTGFRLSYSRHVPPEDLEAIEVLLQDVHGGRPFLYHEVLDFGDGPVRNDEYTHLGRVEEVRAGERLTQIFSGRDGWQLADIPVWNADLELPEDSIVYISDQFTQRNVHGRGVDVVPSYRTRRDYEAVTALLLALPDVGYPRIFSGYSWPEEIVGGVDENWELPPPGSPPEFLPDGKGCEHGEYGLVCEHRWEALQNMITFHNRANYGNLSMDNFWTNGYQQAAFSRGSYPAFGFVVINNGINDLVEELATGLVGGVYCDLMTGPIEGCTGRNITVDEDGMATFKIPAFDSNPVIVIEDPYHS